MCLVAPFPELPTFQLVSKVVAAARKGKRNKRIEARTSYSHRDGESVETSKSLRLLKDDFRDGDFPRLDLQSFPPGRVRFLVGRSLNRCEESDLSDGAEPAGPLALSSLGQPGYRRARGIAEFQMSAVVGRHLEFVAGLQSRQGYVDGVVRPKPPRIVLLC